MEDLTPAPEDSPEVLSEDAADESPEKMVPASRLNGMNRKLQEVLKENKRLKAQLAKAEPLDEPADVDIMAALYTEIQQIKLDKARELAVAKYPALAPVAHLLSAQEPDQVLELAEELVSKLGLGEKPAETPAVEAPPAAPVTASTPAVTGIDDAVLQRAREKALKDGDWSELLKLKYQQALQE